MGSIAFVLPGLPRHPGGGHKVVYQYANALSARGHAVTVMHARLGVNPTNLRSTLREAIVRLGYAVLAGRRPSWFKLYPEVSVINLGTQRLAKAPVFDAVVATSVKTADFVNQIARRDGAIGSYLIQHYEDFSMPAEFVDATWRLPLRKVVISAWLSEMGDRLGVSSVVVPNAIDTAEFGPGEPVARRPLSVLALVSKQEWKRTDLVITVFEELHSTHPMARLTAFGVGPRPAGLPAYVDYHRNPSRERLAGLYKETWVYLCTSDYEGFGLPVAEALASGAAAVSTRNGGVESFAGSSILYADPGDRSGLAAQVSQLLENPELCQRIADAGLAIVSGRTLIASTARLEQILLEDTVAGL